MTTISMCWRARLLACALMFFCAIAPVCLHNAAVAASVPDGSLVVRLGNGPVKNIVLMVWDHRNPDCGKAYREIIEPLKGEIEAGRITVLLMQVLPQGVSSDSADIGNAVAMAMVPPARYPDLVIDWLSSSPAMPEPAMEKRVSDALFKHWSRDPNVIAGALRDRSRYDGTLTKLRIMADKIQQTMPWRNHLTPWIALNGVGPDHFGLSTFTVTNIRKHLLP